MKLIIFDFDLTLTRVHTTNCITQMRKAYPRERICDLVDLYLDINSQEDVLCPMFTDKKAVDMLRMYKKQGHIFTIATYGYRVMVEKILKKYDLRDLFSHILTPADFGLLEGADNTEELQGKNVMIMQLYSKVGIKDRSDILFFDDSSTNVSMATKQFYISSQVEAGGMTVKDAYTLTE